LPAGSKVEAIVSAEGGLISTSYWCDICGEIARYYDDGNGFCYGELREEAENRRSLP
jgi:hypothetical protein